MDGKLQKAIIRSVQETNLNRAANLADLRKKKRRPDTVLHSARIIGIDPNKKCPAERQLQQGHKEKIKHIYRT